MRSGLATVAALLIIGASVESAQAQAWRECIPGSIGPGGCDSIGPGGGQSIGPGGGLSIGPGGGLSIGPDGGQSIGPNGGRSIGPGGGLAIDRDWNQGLDPDTLRPRPPAFGIPFSTRDNSPPVIMGSSAARAAQAVAARKEAAMIAPQFFLALQEGRCEAAMALAPRLRPLNGGAIAIEWALECMDERAAAQDR